MLLDYQLTRQKSVVIGTGESVEPNTGEHVTPDYIVSCMGVINVYMVAIRVA